MPQQTGLHTARRVLARQNAPSQQPQNHPKLAGEPFTGNHDFGNAGRCASQQGRKRGNPKGDDHDRSPSIQEDTRYSSCQTVDLSCMTAVVWHAHVTKERSRHTPIYASIAYCNRNPTCMFRCDDPRSTHVALPYCTNRFQRMQLRPNHSTAFSSATKFENELLYRHHFYHKKLQNDNQ